CWGIFGSTGQAAGLGMCVGDCRTALNAPANGGDPCNTAQGFACRTTGDSTGFCCRTAADGGTECYGVL
ncbi:MAG: hypothetical protein FJ086_12470, partial [Deltaproteobacteria bacterium]|nr:hypothetical protein [Deltaproteobacteria bacterium]